MKIFKYILPLLALISIVSCKQEDGVNESGVMTLNLNLAIPLDPQVSSRTLGDPGVDEEFLKPSVLWVFIVAVQGEDELVYSIRYSTMDREWALSSDNKALYYSDNRICNFEGLEMGKNPVIRAYLVASYDTFAFDQDLEAPAADFTPVRQHIDENALTHLTIRAQFADQYISLRDLYSTPYNLNTNWHDKNAEGGTYYGTVDSRYFEAGIINVSDTLYHVAAKADFQWNPETSNSQPNVVRSIVLNNMPVSGYAFRPTENPSSVRTYSKLLLGEAAADDTNSFTEVTPGNQWSGRAYGFMFQPGGNRLSYTFTTKNNASSGGYQGIADPTTVENSDNSGVFTSWYKVDHNIKDSTIEK